MNILQAFAKQAALNNDSVMLALVKYAVTADKVKNVALAMWQKRGDPILKRLLRYKGEATEASNLARGTMPTNLTAGPRIMPEAENLIAGKRLGGIDQALASIREQRRMRSPQYSKILDTIKKQQPPK